MAISFSPGRALRHDNPLLAKPVEVEGMQRLPAFEQHVVGRVGDVVDRSLAEGFKPLAEPRGTRPDFQAANDPRRILRTQIGALVGHRGGVGRFCGGRFRLGIRHFECLPAEDGNLRNADVPQAIGPVAGDFQVDRDVVTDGLLRLELESGHR